MDLSDWRQKIDSIDRELVRLLNERARCATEIGKLKHASGARIHEPAREEQVLRQVTEANQGPMESAGLRRIFEAIMEEARTLERKLFDAEKFQA